MSSVAATQLNTQLIWSQLQGRKAAGEWSLRAARFEIQNDWNCMSASLKGMYRVSLLYFVGKTTLNVSPSSLLHSFKLYKGFCLTVMPFTLRTAFFLTFLITTPFLLFIQVVSHSSLLNFLLFVQVVYLTFLITTHLYSLYRLSIACSSLLNMFPHYTGCLSHVSHYYIFLLFIQVVYRLFLITTHVSSLYRLFVSRSSLLHIFFLFIHVVCLTFLITTHFLLFIQVVYLMFLITTHVSSLYRLFVSRF